MDLMSFPSQPRRGVDIDQIITGLGMLGNVLALPRSVEAQQTGNEQMRALLVGSGIPQAQIDAATPEPSLRWLSPKQGGFTGKVLGGVGDVGAILSTVVGKPIKAPRMELSELAQASNMRVAHQKAMAQQHLQDVIADPKSTDRDIGMAAVAAGSTEGGLRYLRGNRDQKMPSSVLGLRGYINSLPPGDPRRAQAQQTLDDAEQAQKERDAELERQREIFSDRHYLTPGQQEEQRHNQIVAQRDKEARDRGYEPGSPEYKYYKDFGHDRPERAAPAPKDLPYYIDQERRARRAASKQLGYKEPEESVQDAARRQMEADRQAEADLKAGKPIVPRQPQGVPSVTITPTSPPGAQPPGAGGEGPPSTAAGAGADTSDAKAWEIINSIETDSLSPEGKAAADQLADAVKKGMPLWQAAGWAQSLR